MPAYEHQEPSALSEAFEKCLEGDSLGLLAQLCSGNTAPESPGARTLGGRLCETLLAYSSFSDIAPVPDVSPFDDPFVGAALITESGQVIASHRKERANEDHAEAAVLMEALQWVGSAEAVHLLDSIRTKYDGKTWLQGEAEADLLVKDFKSAGQLVREQAAQKFRTKYLIVLSTLEPCRDFESQPSCARLISGFQPDLVICASDDTNAKGQGRPVLVENRILVMPNVAPDKNLQVNGLFYASVHCLQKLHRSALSSPGSELEIFYTTVQLSFLKTTSAVKDGRLEIRYDDDLPVYRALVQSRADRPAELQKDMKPDLDRVLFVNQLHGGFLAGLFQQHRARTSLVPGIVVCPQGDDSVENGELLVQLRGLGVRVHTDVLRKADDRFLALRMLRQWSNPLAPKEWLYAVVKLGKGYKKMADTGAEVARWLMDLPDARRVSVVVRGENLVPLDQFIETLHADKVSSQHLSSASFHIALLRADLPEEDGSDKQEAALRRRLRDRNLLKRFSISRGERPEPTVTARELHRQTVAGLLDPITVDENHILPMLRSTSWQERRYVGLFLEAAARRHPALYRAMIVDRLPGEFQPEDWARTCSLLNAVVKYGRPRDPGDTSQVLARLSALAAGLNSAWDETRPEARDVLWRLCDATFAVCSSMPEIERILCGQKLKQAVGTDSFLMRELLLFATRSPVGGQALEFVVGILEANSSQWNQKELEKTIVRAARLAHIWPTPYSPTLVDRFKLLGETCRAAEAFTLEMGRCRFVTAQRLAGVFSQHCPDKANFATYLFLETVSDVSRGLVGAIALEVDQGEGPPLQPADTRLSWRGDKVALARIALSEVPGKDVFRYLEAMACDEDETIRWAAMAVAVNPGVRHRYVPAKGCSNHQAGFRQSLGRVMELALTGTDHYWLHREFLRLFAEEHARNLGGETAPSVNPGDDGLLQYVDLGTCSKAVVDGRLPAPVHEEVAEALKRLRDNQKRVLLVLPPLSDVAGPALGLAKPPLGLGSIAATLSSRGHCVRLLDCHRYPALRERVYEQAKWADYIGISVVTTTYKSALQIAARVHREAVGTQIVLGGPAVTLHPKVFIDEPTFEWDYLVLGDGEQAFESIVEGKVDGHGALTRGIVARRGPPGQALAEPYKCDSASWDKLPALDRRFFVDPAGRQYEPTVTLNQEHTRAHMVMSKGCSWGCSFCTQAIRTGQESRRSPSNVLAEVGKLVAEGVDNIEFTDDNLLPQIAARPAAEDECGRWTKAFLGGLSRIRRRNSGLGWRGIMRLEDYIAYSKAIPGWLNDLSAAGCSMLSFGIERGSAERREKLKKGGTVTNQQIAQVVGSLRDAGIGTKGYFVVGGPGEDDQTTDSSIDLAVSAGFTLACFALYKNFRRLIQLSQQGGPARETMGYLSYRCLDVSELDVALGPGVEDSRIADLLGHQYSKKRLAEARAAYEQLASLGFRFRDWLRYNDYHDDLNRMNAELAVWQAVGDVEQSFLRAVRRANFQFYARPDFVDNYRWLAKKGLDDADNSYQERVVTPGAGQAP